MTDVTASDLVISDADAGGTFSVAVTFSEAMDQTVAPVLFDPAVASTLSLTGGSWNAGGVYTATYGVTGRGAGGWKWCDGRRGCAGCRGQRAGRLYGRGRVLDRHDQSDGDGGDRRGGAERYGQQLAATISFSEAVQGFDNSDVTLVGGTLSALSSADGGVTWTATFTADDDFDGTSSATVTGAYADLVGNEGATVRRMRSTSTAPIRR